MNNIAIHHHAQDSDLFPMPILHKHFHACLVYQLGYREGKNLKEFLVFVHNK